MPNIRNVAIIAHVDHGKTTMVDQLLLQTGSIKKVAGNERVMVCAITFLCRTSADSFQDSNVLEKERGITILAKCTSMQWKGVKARTRSECICSHSLFSQINLVDTPGHGDFGGEGAQLSPSLFSFSRSLLSLHSPHVSLSGAHSQHG